MKKLIITACLFLLVCGPVLAAAGSTGANFLKMGGTARARGMGDAYIALTDDSSAVFWNPAGLAKLPFTEIQYMYNQWFVDISHQYFDAAFPTDNGTFGGSYSLLDSGNIQGYDAGGMRTMTFKAQDTALTFSWARKMNERFRLGLSAKSITEKLEDHQAISTALDLGLLYDFSPEFTLGAAIKNVGPPLKFITEDTPLPQSFGLGLAFWRRMFSDDELSLATDYVSYSDSTSALNLGLEYLYKGLLALRFGSAGGNLRAGLGIWSANYGVDYAYLAQNDLGAVHQVSLAYSFGTRDRKAALVLDYLIQGKAYLAKDQYADAIVQFRKVLDLVPENAEARALLNRSTKALEQSAGGQVGREIEAEIETEVQKYLTNGKKFMAEKQYLEAITEYNKALKVNSSHPETVKLVREAHAALEAEVGEKVKKEAEGYLGSALKYITTGEYQEAKVALDQVLKIDPGNVQALKLSRKLQKILKLEKK